MIRLLARRMSEAWIKTRGPRVPPMMPKRAPAMRLDGMSAAGKMRHGLSQSS
ncbi:hypothetical protein J2X36_001695 [Methylobacterium sp. BE186]|nr:hypothetical protein [Methylobacterium sp. BE186]